MTILAIESSCDETSASVIKDTKVLSNIISSQVAHSRFGGVVPEMASRAHCQNIAGVVKAALDYAEMEIPDCHALAVTTEPGLVGSLIVGSNYCKGLSLKFGLPVIPVNHVEGHIFSSCLQNQITFPFVALVVSGGHTALFHVESFQKYNILGSTIDDAAGEAFDKIATLLGLHYPGGPEIDKISKLGNPKTYNFPRPLLDRQGYDFSFSGLKTSVRYFLEKNFPNGVSREELPDLCASAQEAITDVLAIKTIKAATETGVRYVTVGGGVSINSRLREKMTKLAANKKIGVYFPDMEFCMDNAAMIGFLAEKKLGESNPGTYSDLTFTVRSSFMPPKRKKANNLINE
jgi:N6-L-threonylcarbamoyladenine synthase